MSTRSHYLFSRVWVLLLQCSLLSSVFSQESTTDYQVLPEDQLSIVIFQEEDLSGEFKISKIGTITMPLIGEFNVAGQHPDKIAEIVATKLLDGYLVNPQVSVRVTAFARRSFTVLGQVAKPNTFLIPGGKNITLVEAIGVAGGFSRIANTTKVILKRRGIAESVTFDLSDAEKASGDVKLQDGDVITVSERRF
jgi:protein involved in polysaccharide export with SLBB domain